MARAFVMLVNGLLPLLVVVMMSVIVRLALVGIDKAISSTDLAPVCPQHQGNKVSLPDPPLRCVKDYNGRWVCFEGGRDV